ncbi:hypothetical protein FA13DRAFT_500177 [Coprinellus micaceus]|uniref:Uncharacterized protein n=1 Tax=Coprinellus micaceus TaxID=71717 RepID=A0A4Y7T9S8_COPMI|nr:hypothetical protein FA13DRAFT_500177 [Coprinellus micaceus]
MAQKIEDSKRALTTLLRHFGEQMDTIPDLVHGRLYHHNVEHMFSSMRTCLSAMDGAFKFIDQADVDDRKAMLEILGGNVGGLLTWLETFAWYPSMAMPEAKEDFVTDNATLRVKKLTQFEVEGRRLLQANPYLERVVDYALWIWVEGASPLHPVRATPENFRIIMGARLDLIAECTLGNFANDIVLEKVNAMRQRDMECLAIAFASRLLDWADFYQPIYQENPSNIDYTIAGHTVIAAWTLSRWIRRFSRALRKVDFPKVVVKVAMDFPRLSAPGSSWRGGPVKSSFTPGLPSHVFIPSLQRVYDALRNVPDLLNAGLLDILVGDLWTPPEGVQHYNWDEESGGTPVQNLVTLSHHPRIARAVTNLRLPDDPVF